MLGGVLRDELLGGGSEGLRDFVGEVEVVGDVAEVEGIGEVRGLGGGRGGLGGSGSVGDPIDRVVEEVIEIKGTGWGGCI